MSLFAFPAGVHAQRAVGPFTDATVVPRGVVRVGVQPQWMTATDRFANGTATGTSGTLEPLSADFSRDSITPRLFSPLRAVAASLASITGNNQLPVTLGRLQVDFNASQVNTPITVDYGLTKRLTIGLLIPYITTRNEFYANPNPSRNGGTMGINPARTHNGALTINASVVAQLSAAVAALRAQLTACAGSTAASCSAINADRAGATALAASAEAAAKGIASVYGTKAGEGSPFSPVEGSFVQNAVKTRLSTFATSFAGFLGAPTGGGTTWIDARPVGAPLIALKDLQSIITDSTFGVGMLPLSTAEIKKIGDVELGGKFLLFDTFGARPPQRVDPRGFNFRLSVGALYRFGSGQLENVDDPNDIGTGDSQNDVEGSVYTDFLFGRRFWISAVGRYGVQQPDAQFRRIPLVPGEPFTTFDRRGAVTRDLGDYIVAEFTPHVAITEGLMASANFTYYKKGDDHYTGTINTFDSLGTTIPVSASGLDVGTSRMEERIFGAITYSTLASYYRGQATLPLEVSYTYGRVAAGNGNTTAWTTHAIGLRVYVRLFGGADSKPSRPARR